jgi:hypothetical protein
MKKMYGRAIAKFNRDRGGRNATLWHVLVPGNSLDRALVKDLFDKKTPSDLKPQLVELIGVKALLYALPAIFYGAYVAGEYIKNYLTNY